MDVSILKPINYNYFPEEDLILEYNNKINTKSVYEYISFHPVCATSEMVGTSIEELLMHNYPTRKSWECSRLCLFPQEIILRLDHRAHMRYILIRAKPDRHIIEVEVHVGDAMHGVFTDAVYRKVAVGSNISAESQILSIDGIGNYVKLVFTKASKKTIENPFGQVSLSQVKVFGKIVEYKSINPSDYNVLEDKPNYSVDKVLIELGLPINDPMTLIDNYETAPVDEDSKITLRDILRILNQSDKSINY
jgi:centrosomal protein CEP104